MKSIVLAEKPSVAKELARVLNCRKKNKSYVEGEKYIVTWALGHLVTLAEPEDYHRKYREWRMEDLPMLPEKMDLKVMRKTSHQFRAIRDLTKRKDVDCVIIATDAGREGELVARWILKLSGWHKKCQRLWISSQTDAAIKQGFANLQPAEQYENLYRAAVCRAEADWLVGLNVSRGLTCKFDAQLNAGRVQTPTLAIIIDREKEINTFIPTPFWTVHADFGDYFGNWRDSKGNIRIFDFARAQKILEKVENGEGIIESIACKSKSEPPPLAYDLAELQRDGNRRYGYSAKKTLSILQRLYERYKLVTYPRTDSRHITRDMVSTLPDRLRGMCTGPYQRFAEKLLNDRVSPGKRLVDDSKVSDHHAIIPTEQKLQLAVLDDEEKKIYDLIAKRFLTVLFPPCRYEQTTIVTEVAGEKFYSCGKVIKSQGWKEITARPLSEEGKNENELPEQILKEQKKGESKKVKKCRLDKGKTKPPSRYTEASLLTAMECAGKFIDDVALKESIKQGGLGTPATRAEIIEKLISCDYIERSGNSLKPTPKGMQLVDLAPAELSSPELTARWEARLTKIAEGKEHGKKFIGDIRSNVVKLLQTIKASEATYKAHNVSKTPCPICGKMMLVSNAKRGRMLKCQDRECGHSQPEKLGNVMEKRTSRREKVQNKILINKYSGQKKAETSLGDLLKAALEEKEKKKKKK